MKILLINDDGIHAPGLWAAANALRKVGDVVMLAPDREQSGVGGSLTLRMPVRSRQVTISPDLNSDGATPGALTAYAVEGTPADCCILALEKLVGRVDLVVSGINPGSNLGWDTMVSGTVGGAVQGYVRGYPTVAISVGSIQDPMFGPAARLLTVLADRLADWDSDGGLFLNINVPSVALDKITGVDITRLGGRSYGESVREEGTGHQHKYWINRDRPMSRDPQPGTDIWAVRNNHISITPLHAGLGNPDQIPAIEGFLSGLANDLLDPQPSPATDASSGSLLDPG